ncbi:hypothetical protein GGS26DRAFT_588669 [Hypomontagnella submonticulosa]|nr:hypothetical protein GGS26DRAFT_588669 [Hypomontagnella submonticulosa]
MSGTGYGNKKSWSPEERFEFLLRIISHCPVKIPWNDIKMPGRTPKSLQHQWQQIKAEAKAYRERAEDGPEAAAAASSDDDTPRRPTATPRSTRKRPRPNYAEVIRVDYDEDDDEDEKAPPKKARHSSDEEKTVIGSEADSDKSVAVARGRPQGKTSGRPRGKPSTPVKKGVARAVKHEDTDDYEDDEGYEDEA